MKSDMICIKNDTFNIMLKLALDNCNPNESINTPYTVGTPQPYDPQPDDPDTACSAYQSSKGCFPYCKQGQCACWYGGNNYFDSCPYSDNPKNIVLNSNRNKCIDIPIYQFRNGTKVQLWDCNKMDNQNLTYDGTLIKSNYAGNCLDISDINGQGIPVKLWDCNSNNPNQQFDYNKETGEFKLRANNKKCLDLSGGKTINGNKIQTWDCNNTKNQKWSFDPPQNFK